LGLEPWYALELLRFLKEVKKVGLFQCNHLHASDRYFEELLAGSSDLALLGDIELNQEELDHLAKLISSELKKPYPAIENSLSIAIFLVWMGILHYRDNFWDPVYGALELPQTQVKWQKILGETFLKVVEKYKLAKFEGKSRYIIPILAHGYVPNSYLDSYFSDVIMALFIDRRHAGLTENWVNWDEVKHIVSNWRKEYLTSQDLQDQLAELDNREKSLGIALELWKHKDKLKRLKVLKAKIKKSNELTELLDLPERWLEQAEAERNNLEQICNWMEKAQEIAETKEVGLSKLNKYNQKIAAAAVQVLDCWDEGLAIPLLELSVEYVEKLVRKSLSAIRVFTGSWGWLSRLVLWRRYKQAMETKRMLSEYLSNLPVRSHLLAEPWPLLPESLQKVQQLLKDRREIEKQLEDLDRAEREIAAGRHGMATVFKQELFQYKDRLSKVKEEIAGYKMKLIKLGKGNLENGLEELIQQRNIRREIEAIKGKIPSQIDIDVLFDYLPLMEEYPDEDSLRSDLTETRKKKLEVERKMERIKRPLYSLNESTRTFLIQGEDISNKFVFNSLLLLQKLVQGEENTDSVILPSRIARSMEKWWHQQGKSMLAAEQQAWGWREAGEITFRRPVVKLDTLERSLKVELPQQSVKKATKAVFIIRGKSGAELKKDVSINRTKDDQFQTEPVIIELEQPEPVYNFEFICGEINRRWEITGLGGDKLCLLFNSRGELIEGDQLPTGDAYLVAPAGSSIKPVQVVKEQERLTGHWSAYEYSYVHLDDTDFVLIESKTGVSILKRKEQFEPKLLAGNSITVLRTKDNTPIYVGKLPELVFSLSDPEELYLYGVRLDYPGDSLYLRLEILREVIREGKDVYVPLAAIVGDVNGLCTVSLILRQSVVWTESCIVIPSTELRFDQDIYYPQMGKKETGQLRISSECPFDFLAHPPAVLVESSTYEALIEFDTRQQQLSGEICYYVQDGQSFKLEICIDIPSVRWRKGETDTWKTEVEEIWHEDLGEIQLRLPPSVSRRVTLALEDHRQVIPGQIKQELVVFNLRQFSDALRESTQAVHTLLLAFEDNRLPPFTLVQVRTCWQVAGIKIEQTLQDDIRTIALEWEDLGRASHRVVRLWPLDMPGINMIERFIPDGVSRVEIVESKCQLPAGRYRLQFAVDDPWGEDETLLPKSNSENGIDVTIGSRDERLEDVLEKGLTIEAFECEGRKIPAGKEYWIQDIRISPEFEGEERFQGIVCTSNQDGKPIVLDYNPVSFYLESEDCTRLPFLLDRDRDGVMYCIRCRALFWENAHRECKKEVIFPDYILVAVRRRKDGLGSAEGD